jgi:translation initiation factor 4G
MLTEVIMNVCINRLLEQESDEENLECLCRLLTTIGKEIDKPTNSKQMKDHFEHLVKIKNKTPSIISARIKFMILDVVELRAVRFVCFNKNAVPKE